MQVVGLRELKNHLSRYLEAVRRGELIQVRNRGEVIAELRKPENKDSGPRAKLVNYIKEATARGSVAPASRYKSSVREDLKRSSKTKDASWRDAYESTRSDRFVS